eukprot:3128997-Prymnesium_polylepis.1
MNFVSRWSRGRVARARGATFVKVPPQMTGGLTRSLHSLLRSKNPPRRAGVRTRTTRKQTQTREDRTHLD